MARIANTIFALLLGLALGLTLGCGESTPTLPGPGYEMQVRVQGATLHDGPLVPSEVGPKVTQMLRDQPRVTRGEWGVKLTGRIAPGAVALHMAVPGETKHWVIRPQGFDSTFPKELQWKIALSFSPTIPPGDSVRLNFQAVDAQGQVGPIRYVDFELNPEPPPSPLVVTLDWNRTVDFDLVVVSPDGTAYGSAKRTDVAGPDAKPRAVFAFDSNQECRIDGRNHEDVVWRQDPLPGHYRVFVDLFSNCHEPASNYQVQVFKDGAPWLSQSGVQYAVDASWPPQPEDPPGELVLEFHIP